MWRNGRLFGRVPLRSDPDGVAFALGGGYMEIQRLRVKDWGKR